METVSRRSLLKGAAVAGAATLVRGTGAAAQDGAPPILDPAAAPPAPSAPTPAAAAPAADAGGEVLFFFNSEEAQFVRAAVDRLIPPDENWAGAADAGVVVYIDRQLAGAHGMGAGMYLDGPWDPTAPPNQGYQLRYSPAELYRIAIEEIRAAIRDQHDAELWELDATTLDAVLTDIETGAMQLPSLPSPVFFETLLANTIEGYFGDPAYGGNRDMVSWRMIGFPGAYAQYVDLVEEYGFPLDRPPIGIASAEAVLGHDHQH